MQADLQALLPVTGDTAERAFARVFAPWIQEMGLSDFEVGEQSFALRLPLNDRLKFFTGSICGQALMAAIDTAAAMAVMTLPRTSKGTVYQHTHFLRPARNEDIRVEARIIRSGKASAYLECDARLSGSGELVAHAVLEFAF